MGWIKWDMSAHTAGHPDTEAIKEDGKALDARWAAGRFRAEQEHRAALQAAAADAVKMLDSLPGVIIPLEWVGLASQSNYWTGEIAGSWSDMVVGGVKLDVDKMDIHIAVADYKDGCYVQGVLIIKADGEKVFTLGESVAAMECDAAILAECGHRPPKFPRERLSAWLAAAKIVRTRPCWAARAKEVNDLFPM